MRPAPRPVPSLRLRPPDRLLFWEGQAEQGTLGDCVEALASKRRLAPFWQFGQLVSWPVPTAERQKTTPLLFGSLGKESNGLVCKWLLSGGAAIVVLGCGEMRRCKAGRTEGMNRSGRSDRSGC